MKAGRHTRLIQIEGIGTVYSAKLKSVGIKTVDALLDHAGDRQGREKLSEDLGISEKVVLDWVNQADLMRVKGVGEEYSQLLEVAGVDSPVELGNRNPAHLHQKLLEVNAEKKLVRRVPSLRQVECWIEEAKSITRLVTH
jgi:predicted flap endonuclease-1-like 5' DNA nuclease